MDDETKSGNSGVLIFSAVSFVYLFSKWITFKGFNGTDDLHYAMLADNVLKGVYNPFVSGDIFAGRVGLVYTQAFIYFIGGINIVTTQIGTLLITVLSCYLTVFKLGKIQKAGSVLIACALFYFNPVLNESTLGVMPDVYVMLAGIIILLLWRSIIQTNSGLVFKSVLIGLIVLAAMFFKENALILIPFLICAGNEINKSLCIHKANSACENITTYKRIINTFKYIVGKHGIMKVVGAIKAFKGYPFGKKINKTYSGKNQYSRITRFSFIIHVKNRDDSKVKRCLQNISTAAKENFNLMPHVIDAVENYCTLGEIADELRRVFGEYR